MRDKVNADEEGKTLRSLVFFSALLIYQILLLHKLSTHKEVLSLSNCTVLY